MRHRSHNPLHSKLTSRVATVMKLWLLFGTEYLGNRLDTLIAVSVRQSPISFALKVPLQATCHEIELSSQGHPAYLPSSDCTPAPRCPAARVATATTAPPTAGRPAGRSATWGHGSPRQLKPQHSYPPCHCYCNRAITGADKTTRRACSKGRSAITPRRKADSRWRTHITPKRGWICTQ